MGMFDTVYVNCPECGKEHEFQSKSGECLLRNYSLQDAPDDVMANVNRHSPCYCECGAVFEVDISARKPVLMSK